MSDLWRATSPDSVNISETFSQREFTTALLHLKSGKTPFFTEAMVQRLVLRFRLSYNTRSNRRKISKTPGGRLVHLYPKKPGTITKCADTKKPLPGIRKPRPKELWRRSKREKSVTRAYSGCVSEHCTCTSQGDSSRLSHRRTEDCCSRVESAESATNKEKGYDFICSELIIHAGAALKFWLRDFLSFCMCQVKIPKIWKKSTRSRNLEADEACRGPKKLSTNIYLLWSSTRSSRGFSAPMSSHLLIYCSLKIKISFDGNRGSNSFINKEHRRFF